MKRILLVDDSSIVRTSLRHMFEQAGWTCNEAANGQEAISHARDFDPDIIVLDFSMPVMNGLAAAGVLSKVLPHTPLILFTSFADILNAKDMQCAGFSASIGKGDVGKLLMTAQSLLPHN